MGLVTRNGAEYASRLTLTCSDGSVVRDPPVAVGAVRNVKTPVVSTPSLRKGSCSACPQQLCLPA